MRFSISKLAFLGTLALTAQGSPILTFAFRGAVTSMFEHDAQTLVNTPVASSSMAGGLVGIGQEMTGYFSYDRNATPSPFDDPSDGLLVYLPVLGGLSFDVPDAGLSYDFTGSNAVVIGDKGPQFSTDIFFLSQSELTGGYFRSGELSLQDPTGLALSGYSLPASMHLGDFSSASFHFAFLRQSDGDQFHFYANITELDQIGESVPDAIAPGTGALLMGTVLLLIGIRKTHRGAKLW